VKAISPAIEAWSDGGIDGSQNDSLECPNG